MLSKLFLLLAGLAGLAYFALTSCSNHTALPRVEIPSDLQHSATAMHLFSTWTKQHGKMYTSKQEEQRRFGLFLRSLQQINIHNANPERSYEMGLTPFADMSDDEFLKLTRSDVSSCYGDAGERSSDFSSLLSTTWQLPEEIDWRARGSVSPVKNQGQCGSCWAFSAVAALEAHYHISTGKRAILSEQELVDCTKHYGNNGCAGGWPASAFQYIVDNGGLSKAESYAYEAKDGACRAVRKTPLQDKVRVRSVFNITQNDESALEMAVAAFGPVTIAFKVNPDIRLYKSGVYSSRECGNRLTADDLTHAVTVVGFGREIGKKKKGKKYYVLKNSWGTAWGDQGFFMMERGNNMCGIALCASFPVL